MNLADQLDQALVERNEQQWKTIAFVHRHEIATALRAATAETAKERAAEVLASRKKLTPEYLAMAPLQKWETLTLHGLLGTDEPWIADMRETLRGLEAEAVNMPERIANRMGATFVPREQSDALPKQEPTDDSEISQRSQSSGNDVIEAMARAIDPTDWKVIDRWYPHRRTANYDDRVDGIRSDSLNRAEAAYTAASRHLSGERGRQIAEVALAWQAFKGPYLARFAAWPNDGGIEAMQMLNRILMPIAATAIEQGQVP